MRPAFYILFGASLPWIAGAVFLAVREGRRLVRQERAIRRFARMIPDYVPQR